MVFSAMTLIPEKAYAEGGVETAGFDDIWMPIFMVCLIGELYA